MLRVTDVFEHIKDNNFSLVSKKFSDRVDTFLRGVSQRYNVNADLPRLTAAFLEKIEKVRTKMRNVWSHQGVSCHTTSCATAGIKKCYEGYEMISNL